MLQLQCRLIERLSMSDKESKFKSSRRRLKDENAVNKQLKIAKQKNLGFTKDHKTINQPHRLAKHHAMDCGNPQCGLCGNPRHIHKDGLTAQEKRLFQDLDNTRNSNNEEDLL